MVLPTLDQIKFFNEWHDESSDYQISVISFETDVELASTSLILDNSKIIELHIIVRSLSEEEPPEVGDIQKEIERIITQNPIGLKDQGIALIQILDYRQIFEGDNTSTIWHFVFDIQLFYRQFIHVLGT